MKVVFLIKYSDKKIIFRKVQLIFDLQNRLKSPLSKGFIRYQKNLLECSFEFKILLDFTCTTEKFHKLHHACKYVINCSKMLWGGVTNWL